MKFSIKLSTFLLLTTAPVIASDAADITPADVPVTFQIAASDNCDVALAVTYSAAKTNPKGKVTDKTADTIIEFEQADSGLINVTIVDAGGNGNVITFVATATDGCNTTTTTYAVNVVSPSSSEANEGVGNGVDGNTPGHDNNGGNDDPGNTPGNPKSIKSTCVFGSAPKLVDPPEKSFESVES